MGMHGQAHKCLDAADRAFKEIAEKGTKSGGVTMSEVIANAVASALEEIPEGYLEHAALAAKIREVRPLGATLRDIVLENPAQEGQA